MLRVLLFYFSLAATVRLSSSAEVFCPALFIDVKLLLVSLLPQLFKLLNQPLAA